MKAARMAGMCHLSFRRSFLFDERRHTAGEDEAKKKTICQMPFRRKSNVTLNGDNNAEVTSVRSAKPGQINYSEKLIILDSLIIKYERWCPSLLANLLAPPDCH